LELTFFLQQMINGVALGSLYGLIAIGYTMVYGIIRLINFAHGDVMMMGCYFAYFGILMFSMPWWVSFAVAMVLTAVLGITMDKGAYLPVRNAPRISALITAIGVSFLLENVGLVVFGGRPKGFATPAMFSEVYEVAGLMVPALVVWTPLLTLAILSGVLFIIHRTKTGRAMRCISLDMETTRLMGVDVNRIISITFAVGSAAAAAGGIMWAMRYPEINPLMGIIPGFKAFVAAVLGGIGNITGAMLGGLLLGVAEILLVALMPELAGYRDAVAFGLLILILLFRPTGLMGTKLPD